MTEPPIRRDGRCFICLGERKEPKCPAKWRDVYALDAFCSRTCCEAWFLTSSDAFATVSADVCATSAPLR